MASLARLYKWPISLFARGSHVDISNFIREIVTPPQLAEQKVVYWFQLVRASVSKNVITQV